MPKILFVAAHRPNRSPSQRFRFEQYLAYFKQHGFDYDFSHVITEADDAVLYYPGNYVKKARIAKKNYRIRKYDLERAGDYDIVFVQREAFITGSSYFERQFAKRSKLVFDFDDAIWLRDVSDANRKFGFLKNPKKTDKIISVSHLVIAGNSYLADYARKLNNNVIVIPTTIDTDYHKKTNYPSKDNRICIGWTGSITTLRHFEYAIPFLEKLKRKFNDRIYFKVIGEGGYTNAKLGARSVDWSLDKEISELAEFDIGIMPLPDDKWVKGKCGLKGLSYMAMEIPTVMSGVGVNTEIVRNGENGFLAANEKEWVEKISLLIESPDLREKLGKAGRRTVEERYSVNSQKQNYLDAFKKLLHK